MVHYSELFQASGLHSRAKRLSHVHTPVVSVESSTTENARTGKRKPQPDPHPTHRRSLSSAAVLAVRYLQTSRFGIRAPLSGKARHTVSIDKIPQKTPEQATGKPQPDASHAPTISRRPQPLTGAADSRQPPPALHRHGSRDVADGDLVRKLLYTNLLVAHEPRPSRLRPRGGKKATGGRDPDH